MPPRNGTKKTHQVVADELRSRILSGELQPGDRLPPEDELTTQFHVARTTMREALRVLEAQGLLRIQRGRGGGPIVTHPDLEPMSTALAVTLQLQGTTVGDLDAARRLIEPQVAGNLAASHTDDDLAALRDAVDLADETAERDDAEGFGRAAAGVHETLMERSGNQTLTTISRLLHDLVQDYYERANQGVGQRTMRRAVRSYRRFVELIEAGDVAAATAHWQAQMTFTITGNDASRPVAVPAEGRAARASTARPSSTRPSRIVIARR